LFGPEPQARALICRVGGVAVGFAVYFFNYSTWQGRHGLYLEDLYVSPAHRNAGAGKALLQHLARIAVEKGCGRFEWSVLDWNEPAIQFYRSIGAVPMDEWVRYRLTGQALADFAATADPASHRLAVEVGPRAWRGGSTRRRGGRWPRAAVRGPRFSGPRSARARPR
jgi:predicted acetyltransferase